MKKILVLGGLLLAGAPVLAQSHKAAHATKKAATPVVVPEGKMVVPVSPTLPGEEKLSARERVERDLLMPPRREKAAALQAANEEAKADASATDEATEPTTVRTARSSAARRRR